jgi:RecA/RadA recombinase
MRGLKHSLARRGQRRPGLIRRQDDERIETGVIRVTSWSYSGSSVEMTMRGLKLDALSEIAGKGSSIETTMRGLKLVTAHQARGSSVEMTMRGLKHPYSRQNVCWLIGR